MIGIGAGIHLFLMRVPFHQAMCASWPNYDELFKPSLMACAVNPSTSEAEAADLCEFKASLVYIVSSRIARTIERDPVSKQTSKKELFHNPRMLR